MAVRIGDTDINNSRQGLRFKITPHDIKQGQPNDPCACAAARALRRHFDAKEVFVFRNVTYVLKKDGEALRYHTSAALARETIVFDRNGEFYPGEYDLHAAPLIIEKVSKAKRNGSGSSKKRGYSGSRGVIPNVRPTASRRLPRV